MQSGLPCHSASPSHSVSRARGWHGDAVRRALSTSSRWSVTSSFVSRVVQRTFTAQVDFAISIVVLRHAEVVDLVHVELDAGIADGRGWTLLRHFRLPRPVTRLPGGVLSGSAARPLIPSVARPLRLSPRCVRALRAAVLVAVVARAADHRERMTAPAVEQTSAVLGVVFVAAAADGLPPRPAENWTSPLESAMTPQTATSRRCWALVVKAGIHPGLRFSGRRLLLPATFRSPKFSASLRGCTSPRSLAATSRAHATSRADSRVLTPASTPTPSATRRAPCSRSAPPTRASWMRSPEPRTRRCEQSSTRSEPDDGPFAHEPAFKE